LPQKSKAPAVAGGGLSATVWAFVQTGKNRSEAYCEGEEVVVFSFFDFFVFVAFVFFVFVALVVSCPPVS
jgi:hypothetical protein